MCHQALINFMININKKNWRSWAKRMWCSGINGHRIKQLIFLTVKYVLVRLLCIIVELIYCAAGENQYNVYSSRKYTGK